MGPLVVLHGYRTGINAAKNHLVDTGFQTSLMAGHVHYPSEHELRGEDYRVQSVVSACLAMYPHYQAGVRQYRKWALGTALGEVDLRSRDVSLKNLTFQVDVENVWTRFERKS